MERREAEDDDEARSPEVGIRIQGTNLCEKNQDSERPSWSQVLKLARFKRNMSLPQCKLTSDTSHNSNHLSSSISSLISINHPSCNSFLPADKQHYEDVLPSTKPQQEEVDEMRDVDCGYAFIILAVMFIINASTFGSARAYGLIFKRLARDEDQTRSQAAAPFTVMGAIDNMSGPLVGHLLARGYSWRWVVFLGTCLISLAHLLAALCDSQLGQVLSLGVMCGFGLSCITISSFQINNAYFVRYRSRAFGFGLTGAVFGTLYMTPVCQYLLNEQQSVKGCYLALGLLLLPSVPLSLLLRPKALPKAAIAAELSTQESFKIQEQKTANEITSSKTATPTEIPRAGTNTWTSIKLIVCEPIFHLIWPTQLLFCWFNFVFSIIIADFGNDRQLDEDEASNLLIVWAIGQFFGRIFLGAIVDMNFVSYKTFTVICLTSIGGSTWLLSHLQTSGPADHPSLWLSMLVFVLSMFIANLYILLNGLVLRYMDTELAAMSLGLSSFLGSFPLLARAYTIGFFREQFGTYDQMLDLFAYVSFVAAAVWLLAPKLIKERRQVSK